MFTSRRHCAHSQTAIIPIIIGDAGTALKVADELLAQGLLIPAIRYPTVPKDTARLRIALMSTHTEAELATTAHKIAVAVKKNICKCKKESVYLA